ncbi:hypothetical protein BST97_00995 [Nonlabens spongiae]|uniref:BNR repeat-containing family member n=1 Tax=Nonlabens spongiae TaxID=331648 RepID=A0A1W6MGG4_9FLAO|nr:BNR-4 repeat-containing protein [Nonlabens spongiae]ARN76693.1 hypothetical protein BST97_00995 [Nonlabens spongiae]
MRYLHFLLLIASINGFAQDSIEHSFTPHSENQIVSYNGIWSWFSDPRAVYYEGEYQRTYLGWVDNYGNIMVSLLDHETGEQQVFKVYDGIEIDDHNNPALIFDSKGRLSIYFTTHLINDDPLYKISATNPEDISSWNPVERLNLNNEDQYNKARILNHTYANVVKDPYNSQTWYLLYRGVDMQPCMSISKDEGVNWSKSHILYNGNDDEIYTPYLKVYKGKTKIHFFLTSDHPTRALGSNQLYYFYLKEGIFYSHHHKKIASLESSAIVPESLTPIRDSQQSRAWCWDIKENEKEQPVITYVEFEEHEHNYKYAYFDGQKWIHKTLTESGGAFPEWVGNKQLEPHYSGGLIINPTNTRELFASVQRAGNFEIEKWNFDPKKDDWTQLPITSGSSNNAVRPVLSIDSNNLNKASSLFWLEVMNYKYYSSQTKPGFSEFSLSDRYATLIRSNNAHSKYILPSKSENLIRSHFIDHHIKQRINSDFLYLLALSNPTLKIREVALRLEISNFLNFKKKILLSSQEIEEIEINDFAKKLYLFNPNIFERDQIENLINQISEAESLTSIDYLVVNEMMEQQLDLDGNLIKATNLHSENLFAQFERLDLTLANFQSSILDSYSFLKYGAAQEDDQERLKLVLDQCWKFYNEHFSQQYHPDVCGALLLFDAAYKDKFKKT